MKHPIRLVTSTTSERVKPLLRKKRVPCGACQASEPY